MSRLGLQIDNDSRSPKMFAMQEQILMAEVAYRRERIMRDFAGARAARERRNAARAARRAARAAHQLDARRMRGIAAHPH